MFELSNNLKNKYHLLFISILLINYLFPLLIFLIYNLIVGFPTMTINEFRNKHCGRGGSTHHLHRLQLTGVNQNRRVSKGCSFVRDSSDVTG